MRNLILECINRLSISCSRRNKSRPADLIASTLHAQPRRLNSLIARNGTVRSQQAA